MGAAIDSHGAIVIRNSILWANEPADIVFGQGPSGLGQDGGSLTLTASNLSPTLTAFDPKFVDPDGDLRLTAASPAIDAADDVFAPIYDVAGRPRRDVPGVPACPENAKSCGSIADMGAYEYGE